MRIPLKPAIAYYYYYYYFLFCTLADLIPIYLLRERVITHDQRILRFHLLTLFCHQRWNSWFPWKHYPIFDHNGAKYIPVFHTKIKKVQKPHPFWGITYLFPDFPCSYFEIRLPPLLAESQIRKPELQFTKSCNFPFCLKITKADGHFTHCAPQSLYKAVCVKFTWLTDTDVMAIWLSNYMYSKEWRQHWVKIYVDGDELF